MKNFLKLPVLSLCLVLLAPQAFAETFKPDDTILVGFPANNIKDDAYIIGVVRKITPKGDYQIAVTDFVEGHDYGISCVPIAVNNDEQATGKSGWDIWGSDHKKLRTEGVEYIVPAKNVVALHDGQLHFIDRYNIYVTYSRWKSGAPVLSVDRLNTSKQEAIDANIPGIIPAIDIAILDRESFYERNTGRPFQPSESVPHLNKMFVHIHEVFKKDPKLYKLWSAKKRDWKKINDTSMRTYFLVDAIDQAVADTKACLNNDSVKGADPKELAKLKKQLKTLGVKV